MRSVKWLRDGETVAEFLQGEGAQLMLTQLTATAQGNAETERAPRQDGQTTYHVALGSQSIVLSGSMSILGSSDVAALAVYQRMKTWLCDVFAPNRRGTLQYVTEGGTWEIDCYASETPAFGAQTNTFCPVTIQLQSDAPRWRSATGDEISIGTVTPLYSEPWAAELSPLGVYEPEATADNRGMAETYPVVVIAGAGQTLTVSNLTTGKSLTVDSRLVQGDVMRIDMAEGLATVTHEDGTSEDASHLITLDSELWTLVPGGNTIRVDILDITSPPLCTVEWRTETVGVG